MFKLHQQVMTKKQANRTGAKTSQIDIGTITAFTSQTSAMVSFPKAGRTEKKEIALKDLTPTAKVFGRDVVQVNPVFRGISR